MLPADAILDVLRALGEPSRLRIVALLRRGELSVTDLTEILGQSQPRVSRHLKLLVDAGLVAKHREGSWAFFRLVNDGSQAGLLNDVLAAVDADDPLLGADVDRLEAVRRRRVRSASDYFEQVAPIWDQERSLHVSEAAVDAAILDAVGPGRLGRVLDLGTGTGRILQLLAGRSDRVVGLDSSHSMLSVARANLQQAGLTCDLRQGDVYSPPLDPGCFDLIVVHQVLHYLDDPARALNEAARLLAPRGRLLVVDFAPHDLEFLRTQHAHRRLGFPHDELADWLRNAGVDVVSVRDLAAPRGVDGLTVTLWSGLNLRHSPAEQSKGAA
jgi:ArsR family transcriptional regulator